MLGHISAEIIDEIQNQFKEMHQSIEQKKRKIKKLQREGHPASILIKQVHDHG